MVESWRADTVRHPQGSSGRIAQIPGQAIHAAVRVTRGTRYMPESGSFVCVVEMSPPGLDGLRSWIEDRHGADDFLSFRVHDRNRGRKAVKHVEPVTRFIESQAAGAGAQFHRLRRQALARSINGN